MAASSGAAGSEEQPTFSFEQLALRLAVAVLGLVLLVTAIELGNVRGRVGRLETAGETAGAPAPAQAATQDPLGSPQSVKVVLKEMAVVPASVEVPAGTPLTLEVVNQGQTTHNLSLDGGPKTPDLKSGEKATLEVGMTFEIRVGGAAAATADHADHADAAQDDSAKLDPNATPRPPGNPTTPSSRRRPAAASTS